MSSRILVDEVYGKTAGTSALEVNSGGFLLPKKPIVFSVEASNIDQSASSNQTKVEWETVKVDTGGYWDSTNHRYQPSVAGWYLFGGVVRFAAPTTNSFVALNVRKNGTGRYATIQLQYNSDVITNSSYPIPSTLIDLNGSTDYVDVSIDLDETLTVSDSTSYNSEFWGVLQYAT